MSLGPSTLSKWAYRTGVYLCLGLVTTVAVAWALAAWLPHRGLWVAWSILPLEAPHSNAMIETLEGGRMGMLRRSWGLGPFGIGEGFDLEWLVRCDRITDRPVSRDGPRWGRPWSAGGEPTWGWEDARGWPLLCLSCEFGNRISGLVVSDGITLTCGAGGRGFDVRVLPLRPIWSGLLVNTVVYAGGWAVLLLAPGSLRRWRRRRDGSCGACGYDLAGLSAGVPCPECGCCQPTAGTA